MILWPCPLAGGQLTVTVPSGLAVAVTLVGGSGTSDVGMTGLAVRLRPAPLLFTAYTLNLYCCPFVSPVMSSERWLAPTSCFCPSPSTTYFRIAAPLGGAGPHTTCALALPAVAATVRGEPGGPTGGFDGGGGGGSGGGSPPTTLLANLSTVLTTLWSSTTLAVEPPGALTKSRPSRTSSSSGWPPVGNANEPVGLPCLSST